MAVLQGGGQNLPSSCVYVIQKTPCGIGLRTKYCQTETSNLSKRINSNYLFYHLFDKRNIRLSFLFCMNESRQGKHRIDVMLKLDLLLKNVGGSTKINIK